jgi:phospholipid/cholesterol/gamma-HCH transport system ATP-binding protein
MSAAETKAEPHIIVKNLTMAYGEFIIQRDLDFTVDKGDVFIIMGGSGCGKSTLLKHMIGLLQPANGDVIFHQQSLWQSSPEQREMMMRRIGVLYQSSALFSSLTLAENIALPLGEFTRYTASEIRDIASYKLALVGLAGFEDYYPAEISGGMQKRAGLARAIAFDPEILFFDEPSSGLDPVSSRLLDDLIISLREILGATIVLVTHELASLLAIGTNSVFLDSESKTMLATGAPTTLLAESRDPRILQFLTRGQYHV